MTATQLEQIKTGTDPDNSAANHSYAYEAELFAEYLARQGKSLQDARAADAEAFVNCELRPKFALSTVARKVSALRMTYARAGTGSNPFASIHVTLPRSSRSARFNWVAATDEILNSIHTTTAKHIRDQAILALSGYDRLTTGQLARLDLGDISLDVGSLQVEIRKVRRTVYLHTGTLAFLRRWVTTRQAFHPDTKALFISLHWTYGRAAPHRRMNERSFYEIRSRYLRPPN